MKFALFALLATAVSAVPDADCEVGVTECDEGETCTESKCVTDAVEEDTGAATGEACEVGVTECAAGNTCTDLVCVADAAEGEGEGDGEGDGDAGDAGDATACTSDDDCSDDLICATATVEMDPDAEGYDETIATAMKDAALSVCYSADDCKAAQDAAATAAEAEDAPAGVTMTISCDAKKVAATFAALALVSTYV